MAKLKNIAKVSAATVGSRVVGLVRDSLTMAYMSIGAVSSAYTFAFSLPNLFRRLLGEGALAGAIVPVFSRAATDKGREAAFDFLNKAASRAIVWTGAVALLGAALAAAAWLYFGAIGAQERFLLGAEYSVVLFPYLVAICVAAVFTAVLNVLDSFGVPSITPMILNACIIGALFAGVFAGCGIRGIALCMCFGWLAGGLLQMLLPAYWLMRKGWRFKFDLGKSAEIQSLYQLFIPALIGAAVVQLNIFVSKLLAFNLNDTATPALYISSRILEFPLGVFTVAIATVYFPRMAKLAAEKDSAKFNAEYHEGLMASLAISVPAMCGIIMLSREILSLLFEWGLFGVKDVDICLPVLVAAVLGLPLFAFTSYATRGFHSNSDTKTPVKISYISIAINIALSVALMFKFEAVGLAAANVAAAAFSSAALHFALRKRYKTQAIARECLKICAAAAVMSAAVWGLKELLSAALDGKIYAAAACAAGVPAGAIIYALALKIFGFETLGKFGKLFAKK